VSGQQDSITDKHDKIKQLLAQYPEIVGIGKLTPINEVNRFIKMSQPQQRKLSDMDCGEAAVILNQEATYIQLLTNQITADIQWCERYINFLIADTVMNYGGQYTPFEYRKILAIKANDVAIQLQTIISNAQLKLETLQYLPTYLRAIASSYMALQQTKRCQRGD
jgi:hypothetical protein